jgi:hypothetical protein
MSWISIHCRGIWRPTLTSVVRLLRSPTKLSRKMLYYTSDSFMKQSALRTKFWIMSPCETTKFWVTENLVISDDTFYSQNQYRSFYKLWTIPSCLSPNKSGNPWHRLHRIKGKWQYLWVDNLEWHGRTMFRLLKLTSQHTHAGQKAPAFYRGRRYLTMLIFSWSHTC